MPKKRFRAEQIVALLRQIEVASSQGRSIGVACVPGGRDIGPELFPLVETVWRS